MPTTEVTALYATDGCVITSSISLLTNCVLGAEALYIFSYDVYRPDPPQTSESTPTAREQFERQLELYHPSGELTGDAFRVTFCLLGLDTGGQKPSQARGRVRPMFICHFQHAEDVAAFQAAITYGHPLSPAHITRTLDVEATFALHKHMIIALTVAVNSASARTGRTAAAAQYAPGESLKSLISHSALGQRGLSTLFIHHETRVLAAYRRAYYGSSQSPFWFLSKFGPDEKSLVLVTRYYLLQALRLGGVGATYDLQAIKDICATYNVPRPPRSDPITTASLASFSALTHFCCTSYYARGPVAAGFPLYVSQRIAADVRETSTLKEFIAHDRSCLRVSDREFITYIYLAHFECFNPPRLSRHLQAVTTQHPDPKCQTTQPSPLGSEAVEQFFSHVRAHLNIQEYVKQNVSPREAILRGAPAEAYLRSHTYTPDVFSPKAHFCGIVDSAAQMAHHLNSAEQLLVPRGWQVPLASKLSDGDSSPHAPPGCGIVRRLLQLASIERSGATPPPVAALLGNATTAPPLPVYRVAMAPKGQAFAVATQDNWDYITKDAQVPAGPTLLPQDLSPKTLGLKLTHLLYASKPQTRPQVTLAPDQQMYINRNEIFNSNLAVTNIILDLDIALKEPIPFTRLYDALCCFRRGALTAMQLLFPHALIDPETFPCYFFKSACSANSGSTTAPEGEDDYFFPEESAGGEDWGDGMDFEESCPEADEAAFLDLMNEPPQPQPSGSRTSHPNSLDTTAYDALCTCSQKIGMRVCLPVPEPYVIAGALTMKGVARVIQQAVLLDRGFVEAVGNYVKNFLLIDTGVYAHSHSLRLPYFCKISNEGFACGRLLPVYVLPPRCPDPLAYIAAHRLPHNFHFHAPRALQPENQTIHILHSLGGDYVSFFERKASHNALEHFGKRDTLAEVLLRYNVSLGVIETEDAFAAELLGRILACLEKHFPEHLHEYQSVSVQRAVTKDDWVLLQLVPQRGAFHQSLSCLRFKHARNSRATARTFLALSVGSHNRLCVSLCQQCFASKCDNNRLHTLFTVDAGLPCSLSAPPST
ncbi:helicase-primase primase subunit [Pteropodid alphaherpesvirus 1]|uniref:Helicase-primase primase subunit n=1 Tax=Pteropodid alphaherpesvirus 1 TaxID=1343901 RepID=A0A060Q1X0_9ALPH|nr:helicase-primase primase subunit [Pteropodid alphaherpesvirus 1]BAP00732.1 helicase-primase primase subunit [Pteropodid alphaherpesvirus 1]